MGRRRNLRSICEILVLSLSKGCGKIFLLVVGVFLFGNLNARNYFSPYSSSIAGWNSQPFCISHPGKNPKVKQFEMFELGFELPSQLDALTDDPKHGINPFDPKQIDVVAVFSNGKRSDTTYGFYYKEYIRDPSTIKPVFENCPEAKWLEETTQYKWRVRFATGDTGTWMVSVKVNVKTDRMIVYSIDPFSFTVTQSDLSGFLELSSDRLHFRESGKLKTFFMLGQDIAWTDGSRFAGGVNPKIPAAFAGGYLDIHDWVTNLAVNGGNTIRVVNVPWSYEFEWDTVGVYNTARAWELDQLFHTCEETNIRMVFCLEHGTYTEYPWFEEHLTWTKHPYNRLIPGVDHPEDFLRDSVARSLYRNKLRYFFARWGYSTSLGVFQLLSEMDNWTFGEPATQLEDSKQLQKLNLQWHNEMLAFVKQQVKYRPLLTSTSYGDAPRDFSISAFSSPFVDVVCPRHCYFTQRNDNLKRWGEVNGVSLAEPGIHNLFGGKPALIDEMGLGASTADPGDLDAHSDVTYHNSLWATAFSGTAGAGLYWWSWSNNTYREENFPALQSFFNGVDMNGMNLPGHWEDAGRPSKVSIETFYVSNNTRMTCAGWVHNASYWWGNISQNVKDRNGKMMEINSRTGDDKYITSPVELPGETVFEVHDLLIRATYKLEWYSTRGKGGVVATEEVKTNFFGTAKIKWKAGAGDWGYRLILDNSK